MELFLDVLGESLVDTAKMLPFLFLCSCKKNAARLPECPAAERHLCF